MAVGLKVTLTPNPKLRRALDSMQEPRIQNVFRRALIKAALRTQELAATEFIIRGGARGAPPHPKLVTSRTGELRRSIRVNRGPLPSAIEIGSDLVYAPVHEFGSRARNIRPRPYLQPALEKASRDFERLFAVEWQREIGSGD